MATAPSPPEEAGGLTRVTLRLRSLQVIAAAIGASRRFTDVLELAAEEARLAVGAASLSISRWERDTGVLRTLINVGDLGPQEERYPVDETYPLAQWPTVAAVLQEGRHYLRTIDDPLPDPAMVDLLAHLGKDSEAGVPIMFEGAMWGELYATTAAGQPRFCQADVRFLEAVAEQVAVGLSHAANLDHLEELAYRDPLTGLANRRALDERLALPHEHGSGPRTLVVCDVDDLKQVNDRFGHAGGDAALRAVATALSTAASRLSPQALAARIGGDEFCVLLEGDEPAGQRLAESARATLDDIAPFTLSVSCGVASTASGLACGDLLAAADAAQYEAKRSRGGRVHLAQPNARLPPADGRLRRRRLRGRALPDPVELVAAVLAQLDGPLATAGPLERLQAVAAAFGAGARSWQVSQLPAGGCLLRSARRGRHPATGGSPDPHPRDIGDDRDEPLDVTGCPLIAAVLASRTAAVLEPGDPRVSRPERQLLTRAGADAALLAAAGDASGTWLLAIFSCGDAPTVTAALPVVRLLTAEAVHGGRRRGPAAAAAQLWQFAQ